MRRAATQLLGHESSKGFIGSYFYYFGRIFCYCRCVESKGAMPSFLTLCDWCHFPKSKVTLSTWQWFFFYFLLSPRWMVRKVARWWEISWHSGTSCFAELGSYEAAQWWKGCFHASSSKALHLFLTMVGLCFQSLAIFSTDFSLYLDIDMIINLPAPLPPHVIAVSSAY